MRLFTDGGEMGDINFWDYSSDVSAVTSSPSPRSGLYSYKYISGMGKWFTAISEGYLRFGYITDQWRNNNDAYFPLFRNNTTTHLQIANVGNTDGRLWLFGPTGLIGTGINTLTKSVWHLIEIYFKIADAPDGACTIIMDGIPEIAYTGDTRNGATTTVDNILFYMNAMGTTAVDDLALNSTDNSDGKGDVSWCGDGHIVKITPSGSGTINDWLNSGGVSGSANYLYVDEYPKDNDTSYIYSNASGSTQRFAMSNDFDITAKTVRRVFAEGRAKRASPDSATIKIGHLAVGGTDVLSGSSLANVTIYTRIVGPEEKINPVTGLAWTKSDIDGLEFTTQVG